MRGMLIDRQAPARSPRPIRHRPAGAERFPITSLDLPGHSEVIEAAPSRACFGRVRKLDVRLPAELIAQDVEPPRPERSPRSSVGVGEINVPLLEALMRLVHLLDEPNGIASMPRAAATSVRSTAAPAARANCYRPHMH